MSHEWNIAALLDLHRATFGDARMEDPPPPADPPADPPPADKTFTQADVDRIMADTRRKARPADYDEAKTKAKRLDDIEAQNATALERAVKSARAEGETAATQKANTRLISAEARALAAEMQFRKPGHAVRLIDTADVKVNDDGEVDTGALKALLDDLAKDDPLLLTVPDDGRPKGNADQGPRGTPPPTDPRSADLAQIEADLKTNRRK